MIMMMMMLAHSRLWIACCPQVAGRCCHEHIAGFTGVLYILYSYLKLPGGSLAVQLSGAHLQLSVLLAPLLACCRPIKFSYACLSAIWFMNGSLLVLRVGASGYKTQSNPC
jgi:hypothetical protein